MSTPNRASIVTRFGVLPVTMTVKLKNGSELMDRDFDYYTALNELNLLGFVAGLGTVIVPNEDGPPLMAAVKLTMFGTDRADAWSVTGRRHAMSSSELLTIADDWKVYRNV